MRWLASRICKRALPWHTAGTFSTAGRAIELQEALVPHTHSLVEGRWKCAARLMFRC